MFKALPEIARQNSAVVSIKKGPWLVHAAALLLAFLLARAAIMGELYPFGTSFLAAVCFVRRGFGKSVLAGTLLGMAAAFKGIELASYLAAALLLFTVLSRYAKTERRRLVLPGLVAAVHLLVRGLAVYLSGNELYLWIGVVFEGFFAAVLTMAAQTALAGCPKIMGSRALLPEERTGLGLILLGAMLGLGGFTVGGIGVQSTVSRFLVMSGACYGGPGGGAALGVIVGIVPGIESNPSAGSIAFYALSGLLGGFFNNFRKIGVAIGFMLANLMLTLFFSEQTAIRQTLWETGLAVVCFLAAPLPGTLLGAAGPHQAEEAAKEAHVAEKLKKISRTFADIGEVFLTEQEKDKENLELNTLFNKVSERVCTGCSLHKVCWEQDFYKTYRSLLEVCTKLEAEGALRENDFDVDFQKRCMRLRELSRTLNSQMELFKLISRYERQVEECRGLAAVQLTGLARMVEGFSEDLSAELFAPQTANEEMESLLKEQLAKKGVFVDSLKVSRSGGAVAEIAVEQAACSEKRWCRTMVAPNISQLLGHTYTVKTMECVRFTKGQHCRYDLAAGGIFTVEVGQAQRPKEGMKVSGDVCAEILLPNRRSALIMSDGMGAGEAAHRESSTAVGLLEKLLLAGYAEESAVKTVNTVLFLRSGREYFVTLDVVIINQLSGWADFLKVGGAPSLICSQRGVTMVQAHTPPAGILDEIEPQTYRYPIMPENSIVMMSDGVWDAVTAAQGPPGWFEEVLQKARGADPQEMADYLLYLALKAAGNRAPDDMCVQVARIKEDELVG